jgi:HEAT repeat protein
VELLSHPRAEVNMLAGWALMELAEEPEILEEVYAHAQKATEFLSIRGPDGKYKDTDLIRISYLLEALGRKRYEPAIGMLLKYVPKNDFKLGIVSRASAIWALGQLLDDKDDPALRARLMERMRDLAPVLPEDYLVRFSCALALGEMGFEDSIATLEEFNDGSLSELGHACTWALGKIRSATADRK